jgi:hypothetical protein
MMGDGGRCDWLDVGRDAKAGAKQVSTSGGENKWRMYTVRNETGRQRYMGNVEYMRKSCRLQHVLYSICLCVGSEGKKEWIKGEGIAWARRLPC